MGFRKDINGLRAIAVSIVVLFHFYSYFLPGGFVGVDVFFVISGYLMTSIIVSKLEVGEFSLFHFILARARRIVPALAFLCVVLLTLGGIFLPPADSFEMGLQAISSVNFISNIYYYYSVGYFDSASNEKWLLHTWSLSVEWQFYLIYPILLLVLRKFLKIKYTSFVLVLLAVLSFLYCVYVTNSNPEAAFYLLPSRIWEMLLGGLAFLFPVKMSRNSKKNIGLLGLGLIVFACIFYSEENLWPGYLAFAPVFGTYLVILAKGDNGLITKINYVQSIGKTSYSIYLWHWPFVVLLNYSGKTESIIYIIGGVIASFVCGYLSYAFIENGNFIIRLSKSDRGNKFFLGIPFYIIILVNLLGVGAITLINTNKAKSNEFNDFVARQIMPDRQNGYCFYDFNGTKKIEISKEGLSCLLGQKTKPAVALHFGDSFAGHYDPFWDVLADKNDISINSINTNWCFPSFGKSFTGPQNHAASQQCSINREFLKTEIPNYKFVIFSGAWGHIRDAGYLADTLEVIDYADSKGIKVYIMPAPTYYGVNILKRFHFALFNQSKFSIKSFAKVQDGSSREANTELQEFAENKVNVTFIKRAELFDPSDMFEKKGIKAPYSLDGAHISLEGSISSAEYFMDSELYNKDILGFFSSLK